MSGISGLRIIADERERKSGIPALLAKAGLALEVRTLPVGDYIVGPEIAVERKSVRDLVSSVFDGRLFDQCKRMRESFEVPLLVVEGDLMDVSKITENPMIFYGALASVARDERIPVLPTPSAEHTAKLLAMLAFKGGRRGPYIKKARRRDDLPGQQLAVLASLPGIGGVLAPRMLKRFGAPARAMSASVSELARVEGMGAARAARIRRVLDSGGEGSTGQSKL